MAGPRVGVGVILLHPTERDRDGKRKLLIGQRKSELGKNCFAIPGGKVEDGETLLEAARREVREETGLTDFYLRSFGLHQNYLFMHEKIRLGRAHWLTFFMVADCLSGDAQNLEPDKNVGWQWKTYNEIQHAITARYYQLDDWNDQEAYLVEQHMWIPTNLLNSHRHLISI